MSRIRTALVHEISFLFSAPALLWQVLFLYVPLCIVIYFSFAGLTSYTLEHYYQLANHAHLRILVRSIVLAATTAMATLCIAYPMVYWIVRYARRMRQVLIILLMVPFWANSLVLAYSWFFLLERNGLINTMLVSLGIIHEPLQLAHSIGATLAVMIYCYIPFMVMPLYAVLEKLDVRLFEASADLGATPMQTFLRVTLPLSLPGIVTGWLLVFVPAFGEFAIPTLMGGSKFMVIGSLITYYFFVARNKALGAACTVAAGLVLLSIVLIIHRLARWYTHDDHEVKES